MLVLSASLANLLGFFLLHTNQMLIPLLKNLSLVENQLSHKLKTFQSNGGREFCNTPLQSFFDSKGISHQKSCPYTPEQNDIVERKHRHIVEITMSLLFIPMFP